ncbi:hypothetical protein INT48_006746 [Thamnidium elegans]|uniref:Uncharacterized protein n=1 Tax=Thamnidium elegans TaxID=101142 RepID=A0A8H7SSM4_9FUNG|nr:hypothetical protein INT48_006746 [Thamnidium elegans]
MEIRETVKNHKFFADRTIDNWAFMEFLICKEQNALKRMKTMLQEYKNSISSLISKHKKQFDQDLLGYLAELKNKSFTDEELKNMIKELTMGKKENISFVDSTISNSNIIVGSGSGSVNITQTKIFLFLLCFYCICSIFLTHTQKIGKAETRSKPRDDIVMVKRKKDSFALLKPITPSISYRFNTPGFEEQMKERVNSIAYIKLDDKDICENEAITNEYASNMNEPYSNKCEKVLETNKCIVYYNTDDKVKRRLADDIGYFVMDNTESLLFESSGYIRSLKMEMENVQNASFETYKKRKFFTYLYAGDKLTMLSTSVVSREKWGYTLAREAIVPRTWNVRLRWLKVMNLIFYTKVEFVLIAMLEEQREGAAILESEHNGWSEVAQGTSIKYLSKL